MVQPRTLGVGFIVIGLDQLLAWILRAFWAQLVHSDRLFPLSPVLGGSIALLVLLLLVGLLRNRLDWLSRGLLLGGLLANLLSQLLYGSVTDYIPTGLSFINLADIAITLGLLRLVLTLARPTEKGAE